MDDPIGLATQALAHMARCLERVAENTPVAPFFDALHRIEAAPARATAAPDGRQDLPVLRHLPAALAAAAAADAQLARALEALSPCLSWRQNPNYVRRPPARRFLENYGYAVIAGPGGIIPARLAAGVLLLGPGTLYPAHAHPAEEIYLVLDAMSAWWREGEPWRTRIAGTVIHHPSRVAHAMRAGRTPLLAAYLWRGDLATAAALVGEGAL